MFTLAVTLASTPSVQVPVRDCVGYLQAICSGSFATECDAVVADRDGQLRRVSVGGRVFTTPRNLEYALVPSDRPQIHEGRSGALLWWDRAWQEDENTIFFVRMANHGPRSYQVKVIVKTDDPDSGLALAIALADGVRFGSLEDEPLPPFVEADTWVDLPTHDCRALPELVPTGRIGVRCHAAFRQDWETYPTVTYEVHQGFGGGEPAPVADLAPDDGIARWDTHQGHPASDRLWTDERGAHHTRAVGDLTISVVVHDRADAEARALAERIVGAVDVRSLR